MRTIIHKPQDKKIKKSDPKHVFLGSLFLLIDHNVTDTVRAQRRI
jgi:hypothetical protein